jgi:hypothetical protein
MLITLMALLFFKILQLLDIFRYCRESAFIETTNLNNAFEGLVKTFLTNLFEQYFFCSLGMLAL